MPPLRSSRRRPSKTLSKASSKASSHNTLKPVPSPLQLSLQSSLAITPKTASLLLLLNHTHYSSLSTTTPNALLRQLSALPAGKTTNFEPYRRALRRMVWLGTQEDPAEMARRTAHVSWWTRKELVRRGAWVDGWDDLTGVEVQEIFRERGVEI